MESSPTMSTWRSEYRSSSRGITASKVWMPLRPGRGSKAGGEGPSADRRDRAPPRRGGRGQTSEAPPAEPALAALGSHEPRDQCVEGMGQLLRVARDAARVRVGRIDASEEP